MIVSAVMSYVAVVIVFVYSCVTLSYGEEDDEIFHAHPVPEVVCYTYCNVFQSILAIFSYKYEYN